MFNIHNIHKKNVIILSKKKHHKFYQVQNSLKVMSTVSFSFLILNNEINRIKQKETNFLLYFPPPFFFSLFKQRKNCKEKS